MAETDETIEKVVTIYDQKAIEYTQCLEFISLRNGDDKKTIAEIAELQGITESGMYYRMTKWKKEGIWDRAFKEIVLPKMVSIDTAIANAVDKWPVIVNQMIDDALNNASFNARLRAARFIQEQVIAPKAAELGKESTPEELAFISSTQNFMPTEIPELE